MNYAANVRAWRHKAEELRTVADGMRSAEARQIFRRLADSYDQLAERFDPEPSANAGARNDKSAG